MQTGWSLHISTLLNHVSYKPFQHVYDSNQTRHNLNLPSTPHHEKGKHLTELHKKQPNHILAISMKHLLVAYANVSKFPTFPQMLLANPSKNTKSTMPHRNKTNLNHMNTETSIVHNTKFTYTAQKFKKIYPINSQNPIA